MLTRYFLNCGFVRMFLSVSEHKLYGDNQESMRAVESLPVAVLET